MVNLNLQTLSKKSRIRSKFSKAFVSRRFHDQLEIHYCWWRQSYEAEISHCSSTMACFIELLTLVVSFCADFWSFFCCRWSRRFKCVNWVVSRDKNVYWRANTKPTVRKYLHRVLWINRQSSRWTNSLDFFQTFQPWIVFFFDMPKRKSDLT